MATAQGTRTRRFRKQDLTQDDLDAIRKEYLRGDTPAMIGQRRGTNKTTITQILRSLGVPPRTVSEAKAVYQFDRAEAIRRYEGGGRPAEIALALGVPTRVILSTISNHVAAGKVTRRSREEADALKRKWDFDRAEAVRLYEEQRSAPIAIGAMLGVPERVVRMTLSNRKVKRRTKKEARAVYCEFRDWGNTPRQRLYRQLRLPKPRPPRKCPNWHGPPPEDRWTVRRDRLYVCDHGAFTRRTEEALYWAGFLAADGCISSSQAVVKLQLQDRDFDHVRAFRAFLGSDAPITRVNPLLNGRVHPAWVINVCSKDLVESLAAFGITPRKSATMTAAEWLEYEAAWWRGVIDGDGSLGIWGQRKHPGIVLCGSLPLLTQFRRFLLSVYPEYRGRVLPRSDSDVCFNISTSGRASQALAERLYSNCTVALQRKLEAAQRIMAWRPKTPIEIQYTKEATRKAAPRRPWSR